MSLPPSAVPGTGWVPDRTQQMISGRTAAGSVTAKAYFSLLLTLQPRETAGRTAESGTGERLVHAFTGKNSRAEKKVLALMQKCLFPELRAPGPGGASGDRVSWKDAATTLIPATAASWESGPTVARSPRFLSEIPDFFFLNHPVLNVNHTLFFFKFLFIYLFIYGCVGSSFLCEGLPLVAASRGRSSSRCAGLSLSRPLLLRSTGSRRAGSVVVAHGPSRSAACGILPDQGSNPCALHWQADSQPLRHQGSPQIFKY